MTHPRRGPEPTPGKAPQRVPVSPFMSRQEVADYLRIHPNSVDKLARLGLLTRHKITGLDSLLYLRSEVRGIVVEDEHPDSTFTRARKRPRPRQPKPSGAVLSTDTVRLSHDNSRGTA